MRPKLKFKIDCKKDIKTFFDFNNSADYDNGRTLEWAFFKKYPSLKKYKKRNILKISREKVVEFVESVYSKEEDIIAENMSLYQKNWQKKEKKFYNLTGRLFNNNFWPEGKYIVYPTIWGMFPRFLEDKTFQVPYKYKKRKYVDVIIAHEMLHFIFYDYFYKKYPEYKKDKYNFFVWHISEIFNVLIQNSAEWLKVFKIKTMDYPEHKEIIKKLEDQYYRESDFSVDNIVKDIIKLVKNSKLI